MMIQASLSTCVSQVKYQQLYPPDNETKKVDYHSLSLIGEIIFFQIKFNKKNKTGFQPLKILSNSFIENVNSIGALQQSFLDQSQEIQDFSRVKGFVYPKNWQDHILGEKGLSAIYSMHFHPTIPSLLAAGKDSGSYMKILLLHIFV